MPNPLRCMKEVNYFLHLKQRYLPKVFMRSLMRLKSNANIKAKSYSNQKGSRKTTEFRDDLYLEMSQLYESLVVTNSKRTSKYKFIRECLSEVGMLEEKGCIEDELAFIKRRVRCALARYNK